MEVTTVCEGALCPARGCSGSLNCIWITKVARFSCKPRHQPIGYVRSSSLRQPLWNITVRAQARESYAQHRGKPLEADERNTCLHPQLDCASLLYFRSPAMANRRERKAQRWAQATVWKDIHIQHSRRRSQRMDLHLCSSGPVRAARC